MKNEPPPSASRSASKEPGRFATGRAMMRAATIEICVLALASSGAAAAPGDMQIDHAWCNETPRGASVGACYVTIRNVGAVADRLVAVSSTIADHVEVHEMNMTDGIMKMRPLTHGVDIPGKAVVDFHERGYHIMLLDLKTPLAAGKTVEGALTFERIGSIPVAFQIESLRAPRGHSNNGRE